MAANLFFVDTDVSGGAGDGSDLANAYSSLSAAEAAEQTNLVSDGDTCTFNCNATAGTTDTPVTILGWTTGASNGITVTGEDDFPADGIYDTANYRIEDTGGAALTLREDYITVNQIQIQQTLADGVAGQCINVTTINAGNACIYTKLILKGVLSGSTGDARGLQMGDNSIIATVTNCTSSGFLRASNSAAFQANVTSVDYFNCTAYGSTNGFRRTAGTATATNCISITNTDDFNGTHTVTFCTTDDGDGTSGQSPDAGGEMTDPGNGDFSLKAAANSVDNGTATGAPADDIIGTARPQNGTDDIGAYELIPGGANVPSSALTGPFSGPFAGPIV